MARSTNTCNSKSCTNGVNARAEFSPEQEDNIKDVDDANNNEIPGNIDLNNNEYFILNNNLIQEGNPLREMAIHEQVGLEGAVGPDPTCIQQVADQLQQIGDQMEDELVASRRNLPSLDILNGLRYFLSSQTDSLVLSAHLIHSVIVVVVLLRQ